MHGTTRAALTMALLLGLLPLAGCIGTTDEEQARAAGGIGSTDTGSLDEADKDAGAMEASDTARNATVLANSTVNVTHLGWFPPGMLTGDGPFVEFESPVPPGTEWLIVRLSWEGVTRCPPTATCPIEGLLFPWAVEEDGTGHPNGEPAFVPPAHEEDGLVVYVFRAGQHFEPDPADADHAGTAVAIQITTCFPEPAGCDDGLVPSGAEAAVAVLVEAGVGEPQFEAYISYGAVARSQEEAR